MGLEIRVFVMQALPGTPAALSFKQPVYQAICD